MMDVLEKCLTHIPKYVSVFFGILISPHERTHAVVTGDDEHYTGAWVFFIVSLVLTEAIRYTNLSGGFDFAEYLMFDVVKKAAIMVAVIFIIFIAFRLTRVPIGIGPITATSIYFFGITNVLIHLYFLFANGFRSVNPCQYLSRQYGMSELDCDRLAPDAALGRDFWEVANSVVRAIGPIAFLALCGWLIYGWFVWRKFADISAGKCWGTLGLTLLPVPVIAIFGTALLA